MAKLLTHIYSKKSPPGPELISIHKSTPDQRWSLSDVRSSHQSSITWTLSQEHNFNHHWWGLRPQTSNIYLIMVKRKNSCVPHRLRSPAQSKPVISSRSCVRRFRHFFFLQIWLCDYPDNILCFTFLHSLCTLNLKMEKSPNLTKRRYQPLWRATSLIFHFCWCHQGTVCMRSSTLWHSSHQAYAEWRGCYATSTEPGNCWSAS